MFRLKLMTIMSHPHSLFERYLSLLELKKTSPSFEFLTKIVKAHLTKISVENNSKLLLKQKGKNSVPSFQEYLDGVEKHKFGMPAELVKSAIGKLSELKDTWA